jgi:hypothetical protein
MLRTFLCAALLVIAPAAFADDQQLALTEGDFQAQRAEIEKGLADGKTYVEITSEERTKVRESLDRIAERLQGAGSVDELDEPIKIALFNDQEVVNTILTRAASDSRVVCQRRHITGSNRPGTVCQTVGERRRRMEADQAELLRSRQGMIKDIK